jgi:hypothetical protein
MKLTMSHGYPEAFVDLLHDTVKSALTENVDQDLANDATQRQEGWLHVHGKPPYTRCPKVADRTITRYA